MALVAALATSALYFHRSAAMDDPSLHPPRQLQIALGQTVREFIQVNRLPIKDGHVDAPDRNNYGVALDVIADTGPIIFGDHWIAPMILIGTQRIDLPAGRTLFIDQEAGRIKSFSFTPNAKAQPLPETNRLVKPLLDWFLTHGWTPKVANSVTFALTDDDADFKRSGAKILAQLNDGQGNLVELTVTNLAKIPSQVSYLLVPAPPRPVHLVPVYVIDIGFYWADRNDLSYGDLIFPRRIFVHGSKDQILRLRPWVDDPNWTPQQHGMVDLGGTGEARRWSLPAR